MHTTSASHLNLSQYNTEAIKKAVEQKKWEKTVNTEIPKHMNSDQYMGQENLTPQQDSSIFMKPEKLFNVKPGPLEDISRIHSLRSEEPMALYFFYCTEFNLI